MIRLMAGWLVLLILLTAVTVSAQSDTIFVRKFKIHLKSGECFEGQNGVITAQEFTGFSINRGKMKYQASEVLGVEKKAGSHAALFAAVGTGLGVAVAIVATREDEHSLVTQPDNSDRTARQFRYVAAGFFAGLTVGIFIPRWEYVQIPILTM